MACYMTISVHFLARVASQPFQLDILFQGVLYCALCIGRSPLQQLATHGLPKVCVSHNSGEFRPHPHNYMSTLSAFKI